MQMLREITNWPIPAYNHTKSSLYRHIKSAYTVAHTSVTQKQSGSTSVHEKLKSHLLNIKPVGVKKFTGGLAVAGGN